MSWTAFVCCAGHIRKNTRTLGASWLRSRSRTLATREVEDRRAASVGRSQGQSPPVPRCGSMPSKSAAERRVRVEVGQHLLDEGRRDALAAPDGAQRGAEPVAALAYLEDPHVDAVHQWTSWAGSPSRMYGSGDFSRLRMPAVGHGRPAAVRVAVRVSPRSGR